MSRSASWLRDPAKGGTTTDRLVAGGGTAPYELSVTWYELMAAGVDEDTAIARHLGHAIMLALPGIAAIYAHSLVGSRNDVVAMSRSGSLVGSIAGASTSLS